ncbi:DegT/DnrJ/EryC1/StrS aminotransferase family protein [Pelagibacterales bacterium SAG-MED31]|nr:DegT/DnrJ/EryC1/StrS aminotransferase family protein [Pelagibacterales bacterium SAG-MED31]
MRPLARQKIYNFSLFKNFIDFITFGLLNVNKSKELNRYLKMFFNTKNIICLNRGRIGAYLAVKASIKKDKNKVIMSPFTIFDLVNMVLCAGGIPVFSDVEKKSITINIENIIKVYDNSVAAIIITHTHLLNSDIEQIKDFAQKKNIILIEDCAISFGTKINNKLVGTIGDISFFSFGVFKFISSLNGGMILAKDKKIFNKICIANEDFKKIDLKIIIKNYFKCIFISFTTNNFIFKYFSSTIIKFGLLNNIKFINNFSKNDPKPFLQKKLPDNYKKRISNSQSSRILKQLPNFLDDFKIRIKHAQLYYNNLKDIDEIIIPDFEESQCNGWINYPIFYKNRDNLLKYLFQNNRDIAIYFYRDCNQLEIFKEYKNYNLKNIAEVVKEIIILPTYPRYNEQQVIMNIKLIRKYFKK